MTEIMNKHWWRAFYKIIKTVYHQCLTCQVHNPEKTMSVPRGHKPPPSGPFEHLQLDFIQLPLSMSYQYVLLIVCMFSAWVEAFPCCKADAFTVAKKLLETVFPT